jgi:two-component system response regulator FixJ
MTAGPTVHLIDDDDAVRDSLSLLLELEGIPVAAHASAESFLAGEPAAIDCIVTDAQMPGLGGLGLMKALQDRGVEAPVVMITGRLEPSMRTQAQELGVFRLVEKPFAPAELVEAVRAAMEIRPA